MSFNKIFELQKEYSEKHPDDDFNALDHFHAIGTDGLIELFKKAKGRKIVLTLSNTDDDQQLIDFDFV